MKPSVQLKPAQKRRGAERSAVAAVKPLNSTSVSEQPGQETVGQHIQTFLSGARTLLLIKCSRTQKETFLTICKHLSLIYHTKEV